jgi:hypothetical protein
VTRRPGVAATLGQALALTARVLRPALLAYALNLALALLLGAIVYDAIQTSLGSSLVGEHVRAGWDAQWYDGFSAQAQGTAATFRPSVAGPGAVLDALDGFLDGFAALLARGAGTGVLAAAALYMLAWTFLGAAFIGTFAVRPSGAGFLARGARWFPRLLPLSLAGLVFYFVLLGPVRVAMEGALEARLHDVIDERVRLVWLLLAHAGLWAVVALGSVVVDYAKVLVVLHGDEARRPRALFALGAALRLVGGRPAATLGLYAATSMAGLGLLVGYLAVVPGSATRSAAAIAATFLLGQLFVLSRVLLRCVFLAGEVVMASGLLAAAHDAPARGTPAAPPAGEGPPQALSA